MPSITDSIGRVLGARYRLVSALGTGASAHVFLADDVSLHRRVAIKVLHPALAGDSAFLKRFRAEARAVAALNHPNVLQVYDWGEEGGEPYLVLEYLAGGSLRQVYDTGTLLTPAQAARVGIEAAAGLEYAHRRGLVHRDIKPANLLFDTEQRLRITDFGLARALAEAAWTEPDGALLGTARYAAPEQVEGWVLDGKADVYALALVLYEGVTGAAPFVGDTTVATLMARVDALLPEHELLGPLNDVLVWAAAPDPDERYDATLLGARLKELAASLPDPDPLPLVEAVPVAGSPGAPPRDRPQSGPLGASRGGSRQRDDITELGVPAVATASPAPATASTAPTTSVDPVTGVATGSDTDSATTAMAIATGVMATGTPPAVEDGPGSAGKTGRAPKAVKARNGRQRRRRWPWVVAVVVVLAAVVAGGAVYAVRTKFFTPSHPVPSLVGKTIPAAIQAISPDKFTVRQTSAQHSITVGAGLILSQRPAAGGRGSHPVTAKQGTTIDVVVSSGPPPVTVPVLTTFTNCNDAIQALKAVHLVGVCPAAAAQYSSTVAAGGILSSTPTGTAPYGSTITIVTSKGHAPVAIPALTGSGSTYASASAALTAAGLVPAENKEYSSSVPSGQVIGSSPDPSAGPVAFGSTVTVDVSIGPQPVAIPDVIGDSVGQATSALQALGLLVAGPYGPPGSTRVLSTDPAAGTTVLPGTTVNLYTL